MSDETIMPFDFPAENPTIIKVIGVGGGGGNAVNHMYKEGIHDVTFVVCNTDNQALAESPVPVKLQLGKEGLGAGNRPERAREAAEESIDDVKGMLNDGCKMVFITAGMGGGTGTGAAPIIAKTAKDMDILTVGIVTIPFLFEGNRKIDQALDGVEKMSQHVDALLVINNERLRDIYSDFSVMNAFGKADDTLSIAAKSIAEIITIRGTINLDFNDVKTVLKRWRCSHYEYRIWKRGKPCKPGYQRRAPFSVTEQQRHLQLEEDSVQHLIQYQERVDDGGNERGS